MGASDWLARSIERMARTAKIGQIGRLAKLRSPQHSAGMQVQRALMQAQFHGSVKGW